MKSVSIVLAIAAGGYFAVHAYRSLSGHNLAALIDGSAIIALCVLTLVYAGSIATTAAAWSRQLRDMRQPHDFRRFIAILASTQFGKYLPGNVGQHVGRVALAKRAGVDMAAARDAVGGCALGRLPSCSAQDFTPGMHLGGGAVNRPSQTACESAPQQGVAAKEFLEAREITCIS